MHASAFALKARKGIVHALICYQTAVDAKKAVASSLHEAHLAPPFGREPEVIAVGPRIVRRKGRRDGWVRKTADAPELLAHNVLLESELTRIGNVLPLTPATYTEVRTKRLYAVARRLKDLDNSPHRDACPTA